VQNTAAEQHEHSGHVKGWLPHHPLQQLIISDAPVTLCIGDDKLTQVQLILSTEIIHCCHAMQYHRVLILTTATREPVAVQQTGRVMKVSTEQPIRLRCHHHVHSDPGMHISFLQRTHVASSASSVAVFRIYMMMVATALTIGTDMP